MPLGTYRGLAFGIVVHPRQLPAEVFIHEVQPLGPFSIHQRALHKEGRAEEAKEGTLIAALTERGLKEGVARKLIKEPTLRMPLAKRTEDAATAVDCDLRSWPRSLCHERATGMQVLHPDGSS